MKLTLDDIHARCDEVGECWEIRSDVKSRNRRKHPQVFQDGKCVLVRRLAYELHRGELSSARYLVPRCGNEVCINPQHQKALTKRENASRTGKISSRAPGRPQKIAATKRKRSKLTPEAIKEIREGEHKQGVLAQRHGISQSMVSQIQRGKAWRDNSSPFAGLFSGLIAANDSQQRRA
jgi:DNA-binding transcriptional regulator YiaG